MKAEQRYSFTGSSNFDLNNIELSPTGLALFDTKTGVGGVDYMPYDGATVTIASGLVGLDPNVKDFETSLNNKAYYLVTDTVYTEADKDTIISLATSVSMSLSGGRYVGTFVFSNPSNYEYLYLIWDIRDNLSTGSGSYSGKAATKYINVDFGSNKGKAGISHTVGGNPCRFMLEYNGAIVSDTGYIGLNSVANYNALIAKGIDPDDIKLHTPLNGLVNNGSATIRFKKHLDMADAVLTVYAPLNSSSWTVSRVMPSLSTFYIDITNGTLANVCSQTPNDQKWHDGPLTLPSYGDRIYDDADGDTLYDGGNAYHIMNPTSLGAPPVSGGKYIGIRTDGVVISYGECDCASIAVPTVNQVDLDFVIGREVDIILSATNSPTSWAIDGACETFELTGGTKGSIFSVTFCDTTIKNVSVNAGSTVRVSATAATLSFGSGTATSISVDDSFYLPNGLSLNSTTGRLSGTPIEACSFDVDLIATNCFGSSSPTTVTITVATGIQLTPFAMDVENVSASGATACLISPTYSMMYHNGIGDVPTLGDTIYVDYKGIDVLMGGSRWYNVDGSLDSIKVCETGKVCDTHTC